jgi:hypothetical protein
VGKAESGSARNRTEKRSGVSGLYGGDGMRSAAAPGRLLTILVEYGSLPLLPANVGPRGGRPTEEYWLNESQAVEVLTLLRTPEGRAALDIRCLRT